MRAIFLRSVLSCVGIGLFSDIPARAQSDYSHPFYWKTLAGVSPLGFRDGAAGSAQFARPYAVAVAPSGIVYVADTTNCVIRKISGGMVTTLAGQPGVPGYMDGTGSAALFGYPTGLALDSGGNLYVADMDNEVIRKVTPAGAVSTVAGTAGTLGHADGPGAAASFWNPAGVAVDAGGNLYVTDSDNITVRKITPGGIVSTLAGSVGVSGSQDGAGSTAQFAYPFGIAVDSAGNVYVADIQGDTIRKITPAGVVSTFAGMANHTGGANGVGSAARFSGPNGVAVDASGNVYVADTMNNLVRMITPGGSVSTLAGTAGVTGSLDGVGAAASFSQPSGVAVDGSGNVYVADTYNGTVRVIGAGASVTTFAGIAAQAGSSDGPASAARFNGPWGIARDAGGNAYVADSFNNTVRKVTPAGSVSTLAGTAGVTGSHDGTGAAAQFNSPTWTAVDANGTVYVSDTGNNTIRRIAANGTVTTLAGTAGVTGSLDGTAGAAQFNGPAGIAADAAGNLYVCDSGNDTIRKITPGGAVTTVAGTAGMPGSADGTAGAALFSSPTGIAAGAGGTLYVVDSGNATIRVVSAGAVVTTLAGSPANNGGSQDGTGVAAGFYYPEGIAVDASGTLYVADSFNDEIRRVTPSGAVTTIGGVPEVSNEIDGVGKAAQFNTPMGIASDPSGNLIVADSFNNVIRTGIAYTAASIGTEPQSQSVDAGSSVVLTVVASGTGALAYQWQFNGTSLSDGAGVSGSATASLTLGAVQAGETGTYTVLVTDSLGQSASGSATLTVLSVAPVITAQPASQSVAAGSPATFSVTATGTPPFAYQWSFDGAAIAGATGPSYVVAGAQVQNTGVYAVTVSNPGGSAESQPAFLTVTAPSGGPAIGTQPQSFAVSPGGTVVLSVSTVGSPLAPAAAPRLRADAVTTSYQWYFNGAALADGGGISGSLTPTLVLRGAGAVAGSYVCLVTNAVGSVLSQPANLSVSPTADPGRLINISTRANVGTGAGILIAGFVCGGNATSGTEPVLVRGIGPSLAGFGVPGTLADPELALIQGAATVASDAGFGGSAQIAAADAQVGAFALSPTSADSAILVSNLSAGSYTAQVTGKSGDTGVGLVEVYDATASGAYTPSSSRLINISARARVGTGSNVVIAGFVIGGSTAKTVLVRAAGPALGAFGLGGTLPDPRLQLYSGTAIVASNTGWGGDPQIAAIAASAGAFSWGSAATADSAILVTLEPGAYTAQVSGASGDTGIALVEIYDVQ